MSDLKTALVQNTTDRYRSGQDRLFENRARR